MKALFKAKRADNGEWVEGLPIYLTEYAKDFNEVDGIQCNKTRENFDIIPETVCQFTGLTDKNEKQYFFDDVVKFKDGSIGVLVWMDDRLAIGSGEFNNYHAIDEVSKYELKEAEITGNIHDDGK